MEEIQESDLQRGPTIVERALLRDILTLVASFLVLNSSYLNDTGRPQYMLSDLS